LKRHLNRGWLLLVGIVLLGFALRLHNLAVVPLRGDEAFSVMYWARLPLSQSLTTVATIEPHPLLTYITFRGWGLLAGTGEFSMRILPALVNLLGVPALYGLGKRLGGWRAGLIAALFWALHPLEIWHAQDARNYGIWAGMSAMTLWLGYRAVERNWQRDWILYAAAATLTANIYYNELFTIAAFALFVIVTRWRDRWLIGRTLLAQTPAVVTAGLSFLILQAGLLARGGYGGTAGNFDASLLPQFLTALTFGKDLPPNLTSVIWPVIVVALLAGLYLAWRWRREEAIFLGLIGFLPLILLSVLSLRLKIFAPHYVLSSVPAYVLIVASLAVGVKLKREGLRTSPTKIKTFLRWGGVALAGIWLGGAGYTLNNYFNDPAYIKASNWPQATHFLHSYVKPDDLVIQLSIDPAFGYYYTSPALDIALPSFPAQTSDDIIAKLEEFTANRRSIWLVGQPYPDWPNRDVVENWMRGQFQQVIDTQAAGLHIQQFMPWTVLEDELDDQPLATFGDIAELAGWEVIFPPDSDGSLTLWLYWRARGQSNNPLKVFVHLEGAPNPATGNPLWIQDDQYPQDGRVDTATWTAGTVYRDIYTLSLEGVPMGTYQAKVGLYNPETNERVMTEGNDHFLIHSITIGA
jgi:hypothetical protein